MALTKGFVTTAATTALDARTFEQALVVKNNNDVTRTGLLYGAVNPVAATSSMSVTISDQSVFVLARGGGDGANIIQNVGAATVTLNAAPSSNSRYDVIYVKHNDTEKGDANSTPLFDKVTGTAAASPVVPAVPAGAMQLATVLIPAGVTATNASGVVVTNTVLWTALYGSPIRYRSIAEMRADVANVIDGTQAYIKGGGLYWLRSGVWTRDDAQTFGMLTGSGSLASGTTNTTVPATAGTSFTADSGILTVSGLGASFTVAYAGWYDVGAAINWAANTTGERYVEITTNLTSVSPVRVTDRRAVGSTTGASGDSTVGALIQCNAGDVVNLRAWQNSGATLAYAMRLSVKLVSLT